MGFLKKMKAKLENLNRFFKENKNISSNRRKNGKHGYCPLKNIKSRFSKGAISKASCIQCSEPCHQGFVLLLCYRNTQKSLMLHGYWTITTMTTTRHPTWLLCSITSFVGNPIRHWCVLTVDTKGLLAFASCLYKGLVAGRDIIKERGMTKDWRRGKSSIF